MMDSHQLDNLVAEYKRMGVPLDALAYTEAFEQMVINAGIHLTKSNLHIAYRHLRHLRRLGKLPRIVK